MNLINSLTIANWNLERVTPNQKRHERIQAQFDNVNADIWFLTETHEEIEPAESYYGCFSGESDRVSVEGEKWVSLWSRWPMQELNSYVSDSARCAAARVADSPQGELILFGTVLPWNTDPRALNGDSFQTFADALEQQKSDWLSIRHDFPTATLIVAGDFNQDLAIRHYYGSARKREILKRTLLDCDLNVLTGGSDDPIARDSAPRACIDHICISTDKEFAVSSTSRWPDLPVPAKALSDHFGVGVTLESS